MPDQRTITPLAATRRTAFAGALLAMMLAALDGSIVNTALPRMAASLGGLMHLSWVVTAFLLASTITTPLYGRLSDIYGRRLAFFVSIFLFLAGSVLCGGATSMGQLIGFRALQGLGAGGLIVLAQAMIGDVIAPAERPRYQGWISGAFGLANVAGPLAGGIITQALSWRWIFFINLPLGALALLMIWRGTRAMPTRPAGPRPAIDYAGIVLLSALTTILLLVLAGGGTQFPWFSATGYALYAATAVLLALFLWRESVAAAPLIRLGLFRNAVIARGSLVSAMVMFAMMGALVFMPLYFQLVLGMSPAASGAMVLPQVVFMLASSVLGGRIVARIGRYKPFLLAGIGLEMLALTALAGLALLGAPVWPFLLTMGLLGLGMGMGMPNLTNAIQNAVTRGEMGAAMGAMVFVRSLGGAIGVAASGAIMTSRLAATGTDLGALSAHGIRALIGLTTPERAAIADAYRDALVGSFLVSAGVMILAFIALLGLPDQRLRKRID